MLDGVSDVAVKFMKPDTASSTRRFQQEIEIMRACRDSRIVNIIGAWVHEDCIFMVSTIQTFHRQI